MIVTWIAIQSQPIPWLEDRTNVAFVACGEAPAELALVRSADADPAVARMLDSLEVAMAQARLTSSGTPDLAWLRRAIPDQGTTIRLSAVRRENAPNYRVGVKRLESELFAPA